MLAEPSHRAKILHTVLAGVITAAIVLAFFAITPRPSGDINELTANRLIEIGLLLSSGFALLCAILYLRIPIVLRRPAVIIPAAFGYWALLSSFWAENMYYSLGKSLELLLLLVDSVLLYAYMKWVFQRHFVSPIKILAISLIVCILLLLISNIFIWGSVFYFPETHSTRGSRLTVGYVHSLEWADLCALTAIMLLPFFSRNVIPAIAAVCCALLVYLADARTAMVSLALAAFVIFFSQAKTYAGRTLLIMAALVPPCAVLIIGIENALPEDISTLNNRTLVWATAAQIISEHPLIGVGYFGTRDYLLEQFSWGGHAHNAYIEVFLATGVIGFGIFSLYVIYCLGIALKSKEAYFKGFLLYMLLASMTNPLLTSPQAPMFLLFFLTLVAEEGVRFARVKSRRKLSDIFV